MTLRPRLILISLVTVMVILTVLFAGTTTMTVYASKSALPGDTLYQVKTSLEKTEMILSRDAASRAELNLSLAQRRLDEISALIAEKRFNDIAKASADFEASIGRALAELNVISSNDPARASQIAGQISSALSQYAQALGGMLDDVPAVVKPEIERAVNAVQSAGSQPSGTQNDNEVDFEGTVEAITPTSWTVSGKVVLVTPQTVITGTIVVGDKVEVKATKAADGTLTALSIKLENELLDFEGTVEVITPTSWTVSGKIVLITPQTVITGTIVVGDKVEVKATKAADGTLTALSIKLENELVDFEGTVEVITPTSWTVSGKIVLITPQTVITGTIVVGDKVEVKATKAADGTLTALSIKLENELVDFEGTVEVITPTSWTVSGKVVLITPQTVVTGAIVVGDKVEVKATKSADGTLTALSIRLEKELVDFEGTVEVITATSWTVSGKVVLVNPQTILTGTIKVGDKVEVKATKSADGTLTALSIKLENGEQEDHEVEIEGKVEVISATSWTIAGKVVLVTPQTVITGAIVVGDEVEVKATKAADGTLTAVSIKLESSKDGDNDDEGEIHGTNSDDDHSDIHGTMIGPGSNHQGENEDEHETEHESEHDGEHSGGD